MPKLKRKSSGLSSSSAAQNPCDKPKRPLSAYNLFFRHERDNMLRSTPAKESGTGAGSSKKGARNAGSKGRRSKQVLRNDDDDASSTYDHSKHATINSDPSARRDLSKKGRPPPHHKIGFAEMAKIIGKKWKSLDSQSRKHFQSLADIDKKRYLKEMKEWKARQAEAEAKAKAEAKADAEEEDARAKEDNTTAIKASQKEKTEGDAMEKGVYHPGGYSPYTYETHSLYSSAAEAPVPLHVNEIDHPPSHEPSNYYSSNVTHIVEQACDIAGLQQQGHAPYYQPLSFTIGGATSQGRHDAAHSYPYQSSQDYAYQHHYYNNDFLPPSPKRAHQNPYTASAGEHGAASQHFPPSHAYPSSSHHRQDVFTNTPVASAVYSGGSPEVIAQKATHATTHPPADSQSRDNGPAVHKAPASSDSKPRWADFDDADPFLGSLGEFDTDRP
mmetsp:Transcript_27459/g.60177  ORF Transcript_27459/g.60177 Transcript_27459/m.60177 type:complete len:442 (-) Transcript_27459:1701-3026(-)|eukprot:CAMPEP_0178640248 /NCGR_PEP_ID=MMETSP0698-20121128/15913_1 /TAXON_ID=265572 /ORGANISM="Extubocellulus spinifer, Strain CCMP396" /LENGTH=441 /DNA_ID=CAMNT_0020280671 /DNA_START=349 /DNA_END=1674 /DNA_ORIENTATION=+